MFRSCILFFISSLLLAAHASLQFPLTDGNEALADKKWSYQTCGTEQDVIQIESIVVNPDPPQPGKDLTVTVVGTAQETIEEGAYADVLVKIGLIKLLQKRFDVCDEARNANASVQCPVNPGTYTVEQTVALPKEIPKAKFKVDINAYTVDDNDLLCLQLVVDFLPSFPRSW